MITKCYNGVWHDMDPLAREIDRLATGIAALRIVYLLHHKRGNLMPIEIKGLGEAVRLAKQGIADAREHTKGLRDDTSALVSTLKDVRKQVQAAKSDLEFEAQTLGNGGPSSGETASEQSPTPDQAPGSVQPGRLDTDHGGR